MNNKTITTLIWLTIFSIAMGFMESAIVIYLRELYYPEGFNFPLKIIGNKIAITEFLREIATIIMLAGIGILTGRKAIEKFAIFIYCFAIWDIFYYVFLKLILNWPESLLTWDILFLVPVTWVGPVIAPVINSFTMIILAFCIIYFIDKKGITKLEKPVWALLILGSAIILISYTMEYTTFMLNKFSVNGIFGVSQKSEIIQYACTFVPHNFNWYIFGTGVLMQFVGIYVFYFRIKNADR